MTYVNSGSCIAICVVFIVLGSLAVAARFHVRMFVKKTLIGYDDWLCIPALILTIGCAVNLIVGVAKHAIGYHTDLKATGAEKVAAVKAISTVFETVALGCVKLSILFFYRRIFTGRIFNILSWTMIAIVICWMVALLFANIFPCGTHFAAFWGTSAETDAHCIATKRLAVGFALSDAIVDVIILVIPFFWIWRLQMPIRQKISVSFIFLLGVLSVASALCRCIIFAEAVFRRTILGVDSKDILGIISMGLFWAMIELGVALVVSCLPSLRPLVFNKSTESLFGSLRSMVSLRSVQSTKQSNSREFCESNAGNAHEHRLASSSSERALTSHTQASALEKAEADDIDDRDDLQAGKILVTREFRRSQWQT